MVDDRPEQRSILERDRELAALRAIVRRAREGRGGAVLIQGPAGAGKTLLVRWAAEAAAREGLLTLRATGSPLDAGVSFGIARQLFDRPIAALDDGAREAVLGGLAAGSLVALGLASGMSDAFGDPHEALHAMFWLTANLARRRPCLLLVDDLHWADIGSLRLLEYLSRRIDGLRVGLVLAGRPADPVATHGLVDAIGARIDVALHPAPLSVEAVGRLAAASLERADPPLVRAAHAASGGNALLVTELLRTLRTIPARDLEPGVVARMAPDGIRRRVRATLADLGPDAAALAVAASVLAGPELPLAAALAELPSAAAAAAAGALREAGILAADTSRLTFVHPLLAQAVASTVQPGRLPELHDRAAGLLLERGGVLAEVAAHLLLTTPAGRAEIVGHLRRAADEALARGNPDAAGAHLLRALAEPPAPGDVAALALAAGDALMRAQRWPDAAAVLRRGLAADPGAGVVFALTEALGRAEYSAGRFDAAVAALEAAVALARDPAEQAVADVGLLTVALLDTRQRPRALARLRAAQAGAAAGTLDDPALAGLVASVAILGGGPAAEGRPRLLEILHDPRFAGPRHDLVIGWVIPALDAADAVLDVLAPTQAQAREARRRGDLGSLAFRLAWEAWLLYRLGRIAEAHAVAREGQALATTMGWAFPICLVDILIERDEVDAAAGLAARLAAEGGSEQFQAIAQLVSGRAALAGGRAHEALGLLEAAGSILDRLELRAPVTAPWRQLAVEAAIACGHDERARTLTRQLDALADTSGTASTRVAALCARAAVANPGEAVARLEQARSRLEGSPFAGDVAKVTLGLGNALLAAGRIGAGQDMLRQALAAATDLGFVRVARLAREALVATGARPRRAALRGVNSLTANELQVARLAASGLKNREIAEQLFVTLKTVEQHLSNAYTKLGIAGRPALAGALAPPGGTVA